MPCLLLPKDRTSVGLYHTWHVYMIVAISAKQSILLNSPEFKIYFLCSSKNEVFPLLDLPPELVEQIIQCLGPEEQRTKKAARSTCTQLRSAVNAGITSVKVFNSSIFWGHSLQTIIFSWARPEIHLQAESERQKLAASSELPSVQAASYHLPQSTNYINNAT